jgi:exonuclease SbcC
VVSRITIENFQSHKRTVIEPGQAGELTVITGPTDSGKTAVIRALRWLYYNAAPPGDFIRTGCTYAKVVVEHVDGTEIERVRTPSKNQYIIRRPGEEPKAYEGFGVRVPLEVQQELGVMSISIADIDINLNLAEQLDPPFLGNKQVSAPARARVLGYLAGTEQIDQANKTLGTDIHRADRDEKRLKEDIEEKQKQIAEYCWLPVLQEKIHKLDIIISDLKSKEQLKDTLADLASKLHSNNSQVEIVVSTLDGLSYLPQLELYLDVLPNRADKLQNLKSFSNSLNSLRLLIAETSSTLSKLFDMDELVNTAHHLETGISVYMKLKALQNSLSSLNVSEQASLNVIHNVRNVDEAITAIPNITSMINHKIRLQQIKTVLADTTENIEQTTQVLAAAISDAEEAQQSYINELISAGKCPLCGSTVDPQIIKEAM